jgi:hypothetical protein
VVTQLSDIVKEGSNHVILKSHLRQLIVGVLGTLSCDDLLQQVSYGFLLMSLVDSLRTQDPACTFVMLTMLSCTTSATSYILGASVRHILMESTTCCVRLGDVSDRRRAELLLRVHAGEFLLSTDLGH